MPRRDGTGPMGMGNCNRNMDNQNFGRGFGQYGCQRGYGKKAFLETQEVRLENKLKLVKEQLVSLNHSAE